MILYRFKIKVLLKEFLLWFNVCTVVWSSLLALDLLTPVLLCLHFNNL